MCPSRQTLFIARLVLVRSVVRTIVDYNDLSTSGRIRELQ
jgi:hypothetical protein